MVTNCGFVVGVLVVGYSLEIDPIRFWYYLLDVLHLVEDCLTGDGVFLWVL